MANRGLIVEVIDGHAPGYRGHVLYDLVKSSLARFAYAMAMESVRTGITALALSPGFLRSEAVLDHFGVGEDNLQRSTPALIAGIMSTISKNALQLDASVANQNTRSKLREPGHTRLYIDAPWPGLRKSHLLAFNLHRHP